MKIFNKEIPVRSLNLFVAGCVHYGSRLCDLKKFKSDLNNAVKNNCRILLLGDIIDAVFHRDPRYSPSELEDKYSGCSNAIDAVINDLAEFLLPYADNIDMISTGNHEDELQKRYSTNLISRLVERINTMNGKNSINAGSFMNYMIYTFCIDGRKKDYRVLAFHGKGGNAEVTRGMIDIARIREAGWIYDLMVYAHKHKDISTASKFRIPYYLPSGSYIEDINTRETQVGTYKRNIVVMDEQDDNLANWEERKMFSDSSDGGKHIYIKLIRRYGGKAKNGSDIRYSEFETKVLL